MRVGELFAGIGGFGLGLERAGHTVVWQVEIDPFCQRVLKKHWPDIRRWGDVRTFPPGGDWSADIICGGFPCQPVSVAGQGRGADDARWLWPEFARIVRALRPRYVIVENVPGLLGRGLGDVLGDLAAGGYDAEWDCIPASAVGAPHRRDRVWLVAYRDGGRCEKFGEPESAGVSGSRLREPDGRGAIRQLHDPASAKADADSQRPQGHGRSLACAGERHAGAEGVLDHAMRGRYGPPNQFLCSGRDRPEHASWWATEPDVGRVAHGISARVDRLRALGNAIVPHVAEWIGRRLPA